MLVISDTSVISGLVIIGQLDILKQLFERVIIPESVYQELLPLKKKYKYNLDQIESSSWIRIEAVQNKSRVNELLKDLDIGESEAIVLAKEWKADLLLIDELKGRKIAEALGINVIGLLGVLVEAKSKSVVKKIKPLIEDLKIKAKFRIDDRLESFVLKTVHEK